MSNIDPKFKTTIVDDKSQENTFTTIKTAVDRMVDFIKPTYGPASNKVIISKQVTRGVFDDGVQIARDFELEDPAQNAIVNLIREVAVSTNDRVGDGTTSSLIMLQAIINEVFGSTEFNGRQIELQLKKGLAEVKEQLTALARPISTKEELKKVARISFDNEPIAEMVSDLYHKLGKDAVITIYKSQTMDTTVEMSDGITMDRGYISPYMINNPERMESVLEKPYILITDYRLTEASDIIPVMNAMAKENHRNLVIICENMEQSALATAVVNILQGKFFILAINAPAMGDRKVTLEDIALMTGGKFFSEAKGDKLQDATVADLGRADRFICRRDESIIVGPWGDKDAIAEAVNALKHALENEPVESRKKDIAKRLGWLTSTLAVIKVGAATDNEQKTLRYKVEDCVNAVKSAYKHGVVRGAGLALANLKTSSDILNGALKYPAQQLLANVGETTPELESDDQALNVVTGEIGNFMDVGVVDPVDVLIAGVESAVSIASMLVTATGIIVEHRVE
jgi:chaperonin GroEL